MSTCELVASVRSTTTTTTRRRLCGQASLIQTDHHAAVCAGVGAMVCCPFEEDREGWRRLRASLLSDHPRTISWCLYPARTTVVSI